MRTISSAFVAHLQQSEQTTAWLVRILRADGTIYAFTNHDVDIPFGSSTYSASDGITPTAVWTEETLKVDNCEIRGPISDTGFTRADLLAGLFDRAEITVYLVNYTDPDNQYAILRTGFMGNIELQDFEFKAEMLGLSQYYQNEIVELCSPTCRCKLGDKRCKIDLNFYTQHGKVLAVDTYYTRRKIAAEIYPRQFVNISDSTDVIAGVYRRHNATVTGTFTMDAANDRLVGTSTDFEDIPEGVEVTISAFAKGNNNRTFYVDAKGSNDEYLDLSGQTIEVYADRQENFLGTGISFDSATKKINVQEKFAKILNFIPAGATFTISGTDLNDGTFTCASVDSSGRWLETSEALADETCDINNTITFSVIPRAVSSTKRYYGSVGQYNDIPVDSQITVTGWSESGNNGTKNVAAVAADGSYLQVDEALTNETKDSDLILFSVPLTVSETPGVTITVEAFPGSAYQPHHNTAGTENWKVAENTYFTDGLLTFSSGENEGLSIEVQAYSYDTWDGLGIVPIFYFVQNVPYDITVGDEFYVTAGCDKTVETCYSKFNNVERMQAEPNVPGEDKGMQVLAAY